MISQKNNVIWAVSVIPFTGYNIIWYACDERKLFFPFRFERCRIGGRHNQFRTFYFLLIRTQWSWCFCHFHFFEYFSKENQRLQNQRLHNYLFIFLYVEENATIFFWQGIVFPVGTGRKLNVHKTFRRRPDHLLNVLCTFNLRTVPTGHVGLA